MLTRISPLLFKSTHSHNWFRHCATSRKVAGSIPVRFPMVTLGIFHWHNPQPLTEMSTRNTSCGVKASGAYGWQPYHFHVPNVLKSWGLNLLEPPGPIHVCKGYCFTFLFNCLFCGNSCFLTENINSDKIVWLFLPTHCTTDHFEGDTSATDGAPCWLYTVPAETCTYLLTYLLTPWSRVLLEKLTSKLCS